MKKIALFVCSLVMLIGLSGNAVAVPIQLTDTTTFTATGTNPEGDLNSYGWGTVNKLDGFMDHVSWTHHFTFEPPAEEVLSGTLTLYLRDDERDIIWNPSSYEFAFGYAEDGSFDFGEVNTGQYGYEVNANYLANGSFSVYLGSAFGDFFIDKSELSISYNAVPEPATLLLLGAGMLGLVGVSRKKFRK